jgi:hypothetical protein
MELLKTVPTPAEICVKKVYLTRFAEREGRFDATFNELNEAMAARF